ncbi:hypothetical protein KR093_004568 [Drosophila rubida]|uniref:Uncharacterized protein n=1 Tax=Drosophila rubida TaxID=30044 RepID=A0AAD4KAG8_9MUSC|nr:hypothetical protein KR093_004568 [Drosophila rubida]
MMRQLQLRATVKAEHLKRFLTYNPKQLTLIDVLKKEQQQQQQKAKLQHNHEQLMGKPMMNESSAKMGCYKTARVELPLNGIKRQYSVCPKPFEQLQLQLDQGKMSRASGDSSPSSSSSGSGGIGGIGGIGGGGGNASSSGSSSSAVALVPLDQTQLEQSLKKQQPQSKMPEPPARKIPYYNPLRRRSNVDPARVQYIKDRFKERNVETDARQQAKKYVSRTTLHSGRLDKID